MSTHPLQGLRVLDLSKVLAGPLCAQYLGDMGADVIKVEPPAGDDTRAMPPFREADGCKAGTIFLAANRNKRSIVVELGTPEGRDTVHALARHSDVVISSFGPGVAAKLGVDHRTLRELNDRLICCEISGFGSVGPMRAGKGYDVILQAFCGMISITGEPDGPSVRSPFSPVDQATGLHALVGILAALHERDRTGHGTCLEASLFDTATGFLGTFLQAYWERGTEPVRAGSGHESLCPYQIFETADKPIMLGVANDSLWRSFCRIAELEPIRDDPRFATNVVRVQNRAQTVSIVSEALKRRSRADWLGLLDGAGIPCAPVHTLGELSAHPHARESGMLIDYDHPVLGHLQTVAQPIRFDGARAAVTRPAPMLGEHTAEILAELGLRKG
jgi:crotonobetainyl-CoA:carnitine CoA-transferase CaiB-like acyl-CoA transferase